MRRFFIYALLSVFILACHDAGIRKTTRPKALTDRFDQLGHITKWKLSGKVSILANNDGWSGTLSWHQKNAHSYDIRIIAPLGQGTLRLLGDSSGVTLTTSDREATVKARDVEALLRRELGWELPVLGMRYWILGLASPAPFSNLILDTKGRPIMFEQAGWRIQFLRFTKVKELVLPNKIVLQNDKFKIKIIIKTWKLET